jgi:hypothetical protein
MNLGSDAMATVPTEKRAEDWTGEPDAVAAIALAACLAIGALIFLVVAAVELSH